MFVHSDGLSRDDRYAALVPEPANGILGAYEQHCQGLIVLQRCPDSVDNDVRRVIATHGVHGDGHWCSVHRRLLPIGRILTDR
jgi:hypothetical protein